MVQASSWLLQACKGSCAHLDPKLSHCLDCGFNAAYCKPTLGQFVVYMCSLLVMHLQCQYFSALEQAIRNRLAPGYELTKEGLLQLRPFTSVSLHLSI